MKALLLRIAKIVLAVVYGIMKLFPQDKKRVVMISRQGDSPSVDFLLLREEIQREHPDARCVLLCRRFVASEAGLGSILGYGFHVLRQTWQIARARVVILDSYCIPVSLLHHRDSLLVIQIWHALGSMKKFGYAMLDRGEGSSSALAKAMRMHRGYDYMTISSMDFLKDYLEGFDTVPEKVVEIPLPKADLLTDPGYREDRLRLLLERHPELGGRKIVLYCPTFRKNGTGYSQAVSALAQALDPERFALLVSPHPLDRDAALPEGVSLADGPTYEAICGSDFVVSDYSSVIYEAGLAGKPVLLYAYDWAEYAGTREINFDIEHEFPGVFTADAAVIAEAIRDGRTDMDAQDAFMRRNVRMPEGERCVEKLTGFIYDHLK